MKAWLCLNPVRLQICGIESKGPPECLGMLAVYKYKKLGREVHGPEAQFMEINWPTEVKNNGE